MSKPVSPELYQLIFRDGVHGMLEQFSDFMEDIGERSQPQFKRDWCDASVTLREMAKQFRADVPLQGGR